MRDHISSCLVAVLFVGCVSPIPVSHNEVCARNNMQLAGMSTGTGSSSYSDLKGGVVFGTTSSVSTQCKVPEKSSTKEDLCAIRANQIGVAQKDKFNDQIDGWNFLAGVGYFLYIVPGIAVKVYGDRKRDEKIKALDESAQAAYQSCIGAPEIRTPASPTE